MHPATQKIISFNYLKHLTPSSVLSLSVGPCTDFLEELRPWGDSWHPRPSTVLTQVAQLQGVGREVYISPTWHGFQGQGWDMLYFISLGWLALCSATSWHWLHFTSWGVWAIVCRKQQWERERKRLENQAQVGCQEDLRNRKQKMKKRRGEPCFHKARRISREFLFHRKGVSGVLQNGKRKYFTWGHTSVILGMLLFK